MLPLEMAGEGHIEGVQLQDPALKARDVTEIQLQRTQRGEFLLHFGPLKHNNWILKNKFVNSKTEAGHGNLLCHRFTGKLNPTEGIGKHARLGLCLCLCFGASPSQKNALAKECVELSHQMWIDPSRVEPEVLALQGRQVSLQAFQWLASQGPLGPEHAQLPWESCSPQRLATHLEV